MASTYTDGTFSVKPHTLRLSVSEQSQNIATNQTVVSWSLVIYRYANWQPYGSDGTYSININGSTYSGTFSYNFANYTSLTLRTGTTTVTHTADGTKTISISSSAYIGSAGGSASNGKSWALTTIPRATQPTVTPTSGNTAATYTIGHDPATATFYHDVAYSLDGGATYTDIVTDLVGTDESTNWTPAHSLLPNATSGTATIRVKTLNGSGGSLIGTKTVDLPLTVPSSVKPTISAVTWEEAQVASPDMVTLMGGAGRYVQRWTKLKPTVTSAGASGSTVTSSSVTLNGQVTPSGSAFAAAVQLSGAVPFTAVATDSRTRNSDTFASTVAVTAYNFPSLPTPLVARTSDAGGTTPSPTGTYLAITPAASVSSLDFSGEKNLLEWKVRTRPEGGSWTTVQDWTAATVSGTTWTTKYVVGGYASSSAWEVEVSIRDLFGKNSYDTGNTVKTLTVPVPSEAVDVDYNQGLGISLGAYHTGSGAFLQVTGGVDSDTITQGGNAVIDTTDVASTSGAGIIEIATNAEALTGTDTGRAMTPDDVKYVLNHANNGYRLKDIVEFTASGTFTKASYAGLRAVRVLVVGGGGGGAGGAAASAGQHSAGSGGGGGGYAEKFILAASLATSETVTVGAGGTGAVSAPTDGGTSSFGSSTIATGGSGGVTSGNTALAIGVIGGPGGEGTAGDILVKGGPGINAGGYATLGIGGAGGSSMWGGGAVGSYTGAGSSGVTGATGGVYGGGGGGGMVTAGGSQRAGGNGAAGIVIVEVYV